MLLIHTIHMMPNSKRSVSEWDLTRIHSGCSFIASVILRVIYKSSNGLNVIISKALYILMGISAPGTKLEKPNRFFTTVN